MSAFATVLALDPALMKLLMIGLLSAVVCGGVAYAVLDTLQPADRSHRVAKMKVARQKKLAKGGLLSLLEKDSESPEARRKTLERAQQAEVTFAMKVEQAGLSISPILLYAIFAAVAGLVAMFAVQFGAPLYLGASLFAVLTFFGPKILVNKLIDKRREAFLSVFPTAIDILVRGVKAGLPVNEGLKVIANEVDGPCGEEVERMVAATNVGFSLEEAASQLAMRIPSSDVTFFRTVLIIQKQTGGNLAEALSNLSAIIRERQKLSKKVWALSSEARTSAIIIGSLPILIAGGVFLMKPDYFNIMLESFGGQLAIGGAVVWMVIGVVVMRIMINFKV